MYRCAVARACCGAAHRILNRRRCSGDSNAYHDYPDPYHDCLYSLTTIIRTLPTIIRTLTTIIRTLNHEYPYPSRARCGPFVRVRARTRLPAGCLVPLRFRDVSWFNARSRSHTLAPLGWEEVRPRASVLLPHLRRD